MKINIVGFYGRANAGDEIFKLAFKEIFDKEELVFTTGKVSKQHDKIILGAGNLINPYFLDVPELKNNQHFDTIGTGLGYKSEANLLKKYNIGHAYVRNKDDVMLIQKACPEIKTEYIPDIAFLVDPAKHLDDSVKISLSYHKTNKKKTMVVCLTDCINASRLRNKRNENAYGEYLKWELAAIFDDLRQWYDIVFLPLSTRMPMVDTRIHLDVATRMKEVKTNQIVSKDLTPLQTLKMIGDADLVVSMKFHGLIFATMMGVPFINIGLTRKTSQYCLEQGLSNVSVNPFSLTKDRFIRAVKHAETKGLKEKLLDITLKNRNILLDKKEEIRNSILTSEKK